MRSKTDHNGIAEAQATHPEVIVYGVFKGMGDLLNAAPVILEELNAGTIIKLLVFPRFGIEEFSRLIDFGVNYKNLELIPLPLSWRWADLKQFYFQMKQIKAHLIWISPHAPRPSASKKIPLALWMMKHIFWRQAQLAGADSEPLSQLFDVRVYIDRNWPLMEREYSAYSMLRRFSASGPLRPAAFVERIRCHRDEEPVFDLLIHPGANAVNRSWPYAHFAALFNWIPAHFRIAVLGLPKDIDQAKCIFPMDRGIHFLTGTLEEAITLISSSRVLLSMDSGNVHFANCLHLPVVALYGKSDPASIVGTRGSVFPIYERNFPCQPCGLPVCKQPEVYCMNSIAPETVARKLLELLEGNPRRATDAGCASIN